MSEEKAEYINSPVDELKPCPCGGKMAWCGDQRQEYEDGTVEETHDCHQLVCLKCEMQIDYNCKELKGCSTFKEMRKIVAAKWNTRAESPDSVEEWPKVELMHNESQYEVFQITASNGQQALVYPDDTALYELIKAKTVSALSSRCGAPPVAGGDVDYCAMFTSLCEGLEIDPAIVGVSTLAGIKAVGKAIATQAKSAALQHQDNVVISEEDLGELIEAAEFTLENFTKEIQPIQSPIHEMGRKLTGVISRAKQSLERKNESD